MNFQNKLSLYKKEIRNFTATTVHKLWVAFYIICACLTLLKRALVHDLSKYKSPEREQFRDILPELSSTTYGTHEYQKLLKRLEIALRHHYQHNSHHPEFYHDSNGYQRMSPMDKIEMLCDWRAATRRHDDGDLRDSIRKNKKRFNYNNLDRHSLLRDAKEIGLIE